MQVFDCTENMKGSREHFIAFLSLLIIFSNEDLVRNSVYHMHASMHTCINTKGRIFYF